VDGRVGGSGGWKHNVMFEDGKGRVYLFGKREKYSKGDGFDRWEMRVCFFGKREKYSKGDTTAAARGRVRFPTELCHVLLDKRFLTR